MENAIDNSSIAIVDVPCPNIWGLQFKEKTNMQLNAIEPSWRKEENKTHKMLHPTWSILVLPP